MKATMPLRNGEWSTSPVSRSRRNPASGTRPTSTTAAESRAAVIAKRRPRRSATVSGSMACARSAPAYVPRRGTTTHSVTAVPTVAMRNVETAMK